MTTRRSTSSIWGRPRRSERNGFRLKPLALFGTALAASVTAFGPLDTAPYLAFEDGSEPGVLVHWNTSVETLCGLAFGTSPLMPDTSWEESPRFFHHLPITGIEPGSTCFYSVVPGGESRSFTFPGAPGTSFSFAVYGDTRTDLAAHRAVVEAMAGEEFDFFMHVGDLVETGDSTLDWKGFFDVECILAGSRPICPVQGNHEAPYWPFDTLFVLPGAEDWYSFDFMNCHFVCLDTETDLLGVQRGWLENDLAGAASNPGTDWIIAVLHRPPYSSGSHGSQLDVREAWCPLFERHGVDVVFSGHDHCYERSIPINGVVYIVTGGGGAPLHRAGSNWWTAFSDSTYEFCLVEVEGDVLTVNAVKPDGEVFDGVTLVHSAAGDPAFHAAGGLRASLSSNPAEDAALIRLYSSAGGPVSVDVFDVSGRLADSFTLYCPSGETIEEQWPRSSLPEAGAGLYIFTFRQGPESVSLGLVLLDR